MGEPGLEEVREDMPDRAEADDSVVHPEDAQEADLPVAVEGEAPGAEDQQDSEEAATPEVVSVGHISTKLISPEVEKAVITALVKVGPGEPLEAALQEAGITLDDYLELASQPAFVEEIYNEAVAINLVPQFGAVMEHLVTLTLDAKSPAAMRTYFELLGRLSSNKEERHLHLHTLDDNEISVLSNRIEQKLKKLKENDGK